MSITEKLDNALIQVETLLSQADNDIHRLDQALPSQRLNFQNEIKSKLDEINSKIAKITNDSKSIPPTSRQYYTDEISSLSTRLNNLRSDLRRKETLASNDKSIKQANQLQTNINKQQGITENLDEAIRLGIDAVTTGNATMSTLHDDKIRLQHIDSNVVNIHQEAISGTERARRMVRRACFNNFIIWTVVVLLVALLGFSLYWKLRK